MATAMRPAGTASASMAKSRPVSFSRRNCATVRSMAAKKSAEVGFRYDASNLRWVRDDRYIGKKMETMVTPKSGTPFPIWPVVHYELSSKGVKGVKPDKAAQLQAQGWTLLDVRLGDDFAVEHCEGAINVPLFRITAGNETWDKIKRFVMSSLVMKATERDPDFKTNVLKVLKKNQKVIVVCAIGGTLETKFKPSAHKAAIDDPDRAFGRESRSLKAAHELLQAGWSASNIQFMMGGLQQWRHDGFPVASGDE